MNWKRARLFIVCLWPLWCSASFFEAHQEGWFWYDSVEPEKRFKPQVSPPPRESQFKFNPTQLMKAYQSKVQDSLNLAILHPTEENLIAYAQHYFQTMNKAQRFTDAYQQMLLHHPVFDYSLHFPISAFAHQVYLKKQKEKHQQTIQLFSKNHGLLFFFSSQCEYCKVFAPIVKAFSEQYGVSILAISMDGQGLFEFPNFVSDRGASQSLNVQRFPTLLAINPKTNIVSTLAIGAISQTQLEENILRFLKAAALQEVPHE